MIGDTENMIELLRTMPSTVYLLLLLPIILMSAPTVCGTHEFPVFRMQQYDLNGVKHGSRAAAINLEARSLSSENLIRRCVVVRAGEVSINLIQKAVNDGLSALLLLIPPNLDDLSEKHLEHFQQLEIDLLEANLPIPVYFAHENERLTTLYEEISDALTGDASSALRAMTNVASANSFHLVTDCGESKPMTDFPIASIQGKLSGQGLEDQLPTIAIVTHYDAFGIVPKLSTGVDASGSGVIALLELARIFNKLYGKLSTQPKFNLLFLMAGGGKFNYQGSKKWLEDNVESSEISLLAEADFVLCIDAIGNGNNLNLHVSKPPKEGTQAIALVKEFQQVTEDIFPESNFNVVHKKINLADEMLAWEHERFSIRRLTAGTLSHQDAPSKQHGSILDRKMDIKSLVRNIKIVSEGLARHIFNLSGKGFSGDVQIFAEDLAPDMDHINSWLSYLEHTPRSQQLTNKDGSLLAALQEALSQYLNDVTKFTTKADKKDPEFVFYDVFEAKMSVYSVKPALFDLFLAFGIGSYLAIVYFFLQNFSIFIDMLPKPVANGKTH